MDKSNPFGLLIENIWNVLLERVDEIQDLKSIDEKFSTLFKFFSENIEVQNELNTKLITSVEGDEEKDLEKSKKYREDGNKLFLSGKLNECLKCYNKSVLLAPGSKNYEEDREYIDLAMSLTNRAAVLGKLKMHKNAVEDLELAISCGYPKHLLYKAYQRLGVSYEAMGNTEKAKSAYENLLQFLNYSDIPNDRIKSMKDQAMFVLSSLIDGIPEKNQPKSISLQSHNQQAQWPEKRLMWEKL